MPILRVRDNDGNITEIPAIKGQDGYTPVKGVDYFDGQDGADGLTPYIGANGNWWVGDTDTGTKAQGEPGQDAILGEYELIASGETIEEVNGVSVTKDNDGNPFSLCDRVTIYMECPPAAVDTNMIILVNGKIVGLISNYTNTGNRRYARAMCIYSGKCWDCYTTGSASNTSANMSVSTRMTHDLKMDDSVVNSIRLYLSSDNVLPVGFKYQVYGKRA